MPHYDLRGLLQSDHNCDLLPPKSNSIICSGWHVYCCFCFVFFVERTDSQFIHKLRVSTVSADSKFRVRRRLVWFKTIGTGRHQSGIMGALQSHALTLIICFPFDAQSNISWCCVCVCARERRRKKKKANAVICKNPHITNPDLSCFPLLTSLLSCAPLPPSLSLFLALPSQLSLIACEVINGFHLTSSPTLRRAPTNKTGAQNTNCPSEEP